MPSEDAYPAAALARLCIYRVGFIDPHEKQNSPNLPTAESRCSQSLKLEHRPNLWEKKTFLNFSSKSKREASEPRGEEFFSQLVSPVRSTISFGCVLLRTHANDSQVTQTFQTPSKVRRSGDQEHFPPKTPSPDIQGSKRLVMSWEKLYFSLLKQRSRTQEPRHGQLRKGCWQR